MSSQLGVDSPLYIQFLFLITVNLVNLVEEQPRAG